MSATAIKHALQPGAAVRLIQPATRRDVATRKPVRLECGWDLEIVGPDGEYGGVPAYRARDAFGRVWHGILAAWFEPVGRPAATADGLFD